MKILTLEAMQKIFHDNDAIGITGYPGSGKTTLSKLYPGPHVIHTDDYLHLPHEDIPDSIRRGMSFIRRYLVEGTQTTRLLSRGWKPDALIFCMGSEREDVVGINRMIDKHLKVYKGPLFYVNPRDFIK